MLSARHPHQIVLGMLAPVTYKGLTHKLLIGFLITKDLYKRYWKLLSLIIPFLAQAASLLELMH